MSLRTEQTEQLKDAAKVPVNISVRPTLRTRLWVPISFFVFLNSLFLFTLSRQLYEQWTATKASSNLPSETMLAQSEARQLVNVMARSQQVYYLKHNEFSTNLRDLHGDIQPDTARYFYRTFTYPDRQGLVMVAAIPRHAGYKTYLGFVNVLKATGIHDTITEATLCESREARPLLRRLPKQVPNSGIVSCPLGFVAAPMI